MANTVQLTKNGQPVFPVTDVSLVMGLQDAIKLPPVKVATLPTASAETAGKMYYVGPDENDEYERYITSAVEGSYDWIDLGDTAIPLPSIADNLTTDDENTALSAKQGKVLKDDMDQLGAEVNENNFGDTIASVSGNPSGSIGVDFENGLKYYVAFTVTDSTTFDITLRSADGSTGPIVQTVAASKTYAPGDYIVPFVCGVTTAKYIRFGNSSVWANITSVGVYNTVKESTAASFAEFSEKLLQARQAIYLCTIKSAGGRAVSSITKNGAAVSLVFGGDLVVYGRKTTGNTGNAYISLPTNGATYNFASNLDGLFLDLISQTLTIASCASVYGLETALNSPDKVLLAVNLWGQLISPVATLQSEFDAIQFADDTAITENTPNNYTTRIVKGGVTHEVANGNVSDYFKSRSATFGLFEKTGTSSASQVIGMPVSEGGKLASVYLNNAESATISIKIYNSDFSVVRKTISKSVTSGENNITLNEDVTAGENIVLEGAKPYFANDSSFEQIFWYNYGGSTGWALRSDHIKWSAGYTLVSDSVFDTLSNKVSELENKEEDLEDRVDALEQNIEYVTVTVQRNLADFNSVRETIDAITDASYYKRYIVIVPIGRWFECDIKGKKYVTIQGVDARKTVLYCDGTSDKVTPDDYSFDTYAGQSLSSINQAYKHIINVRDDIDVRGLTLEVNDCKYCAHIDNTGFKTASFKEIFFKEINANVTFTIGIGSHAGQEILFERCDFKAYDTHTICAYVHNWNNLTAINTVTFKDCQFNKNFFRYDELGSDYSTFLNLLNCYSSAATPQLVFQTVTTGGHSHWIDPETGDPITDMTQLPYCTHIDVCGSNVASIYQDGTRPDIADYIIGRIG